jgi:ubiquinone/menaquinone biosynthesis C-methylase UbiE
VTATRDPEQVEARLVELVDAWIRYGTWRKDFAVYRQNMVENERHQRHKVELLELASGGLTDRPVLEVGCGAGGLSVALVLQSVRVVPCDLSELCCEMTRLRALRHGLALHPIVGSAECLPLPTGSFSVIACFDVLEHVARPQVALRELHRVLTPGGVCVVNFHHRFAVRDPHFRLSFVNWMPRTVAEWWIDRHGRGPRAHAGLTAECGQRLGEMHYYTPGAFRRACDRAGLRCRVLPPDFGGRKLSMKRCLRPFQDQYAAVLTRAG